MVNIALLATDYFPTVSEASKLKTQLEEQLHRLRSVDEEIASLERLLQPLLELRAELQRSCAVAESLMAPIRKIPIEILEEIFLQAIPSFGIISLHDNRDGRDPNWDPLKAYPPYRDPSKVRSDLRRVCRRWRSVVDMAPKAWSTIMFRYVYSEPAALERFFAKSKSYPLDAYFCDGFFSPDCYALIRRHLLRMRLLIIKSPSYDLQQIFPLGRRTETSIKGFVILGGHNSAGFVPCGTIHAPNLSYLALRHQTDINAFTYESLLSLRWLRLPFDLSERMSFHNILSLCPDLEVLQVTHFHQYGHNLDPHISLTPVTFSSLKLLMVEDVTEALFLLNGLHAPALEELCFDASLEDRNLSSVTPAGKTFTSLLRTKFPRLRTLWLQYSDELEGAAVSILFGGLPNITNVHILSCSLSSHFFSALTPEDHTLPLVWPRLQRLFITNTSFTVSDLLRFLSSRILTDVEPQSLGPLMTVKIRGCFRCSDKQRELDGLQEQFSDVVTVSN